MAEPALKYEDDELNPGQSHYKKQFSVIDGGGNSTADRADLRSIDNLEANPEQISDKSIGEREANGSNVIQGPWANNTTSEKIANTTSKNEKGKLANFLKKKGAISLIITIFGGGGLALTSLLSPGLLIVNLKEVMVNKFNNQAASMEVRTTKTFRARATGVGCAKNIKILCKYSSFSESQISRMKEKGIEIVGGKKTSSNGITQPEGFKYQDMEIKASNISNALDSNAEFRLAMRKAYNPGFAGFTDEIWEKVAKLFKVTKTATHFEGDTFDEKMENTVKEIKDNHAPKKMAQVTEDDYNTQDGGDKKFGDEIDPATKKPYRDGPNPNPDMEKANENIKAVNEMIEDLGDTSASSKVLKEASNVIKITGIVDETCTVYRTTVAVGYAAKTLRVLQVSAYAFMFLNMADQIKAGDANEQDVTFLGDVLTKLTNDVDPYDDTYKSSATDSVGYRWATDGDQMAMPTSSMQYMAAGGFAGLLLGFLDKYIPGNAKSTCKFLGNPIVGFISLGIGAALMALPFVGPGAKAAQATTEIAAKMTFKQAFKEMLISSMKTTGFWVGVSLAAAEMFLPGLLQDIIAGNVINKGTVGSFAGDAITSGSATIMSQSAKQGGNAPLTPSQAVKYDGIKADIAAKYAEEDRLTYSPLDATNGNTFVGKIVAWLMPFSTKVSSLTGMLSSIASIVTKSFSLLLPQVSKAVSTTESTYTRCQDEDYIELGVARDIFCNVYYGIPPEDLNAKDPVELAEGLVNYANPTYKFEYPTSGQQYYKDNETPHTAQYISLIDENGEPTAPYRDFISNCIDRDTGGIVPLVKSSSVGEDYKRDDPHARGALSGTSQVNGASDCMYASGFDEQKNSWCDVENDPWPVANQGYIFLTDWRYEIPDECTKTAADGTITTYPKQYHRYHYIGNAELYIYQIDKRISDGMDSVVSSSGSSSSNSASTTTTGKITSPITGYDWSESNTGVSTGKCSDHGAVPGTVDICDPDHYDNSGHNTYNMAGDALDMAEPAGTIIVAAHDGVVENVGDCTFGNGKILRIRSKDGKYYSSYAHLDFNLKVSEGQEVRAGEELGVLYSLSSGDHLHFEIMIDDNWVRAGDMASYLK